MITMLGSNTLNKVIPIKGPIASVRYASKLTVGQEIWAKGSLDAVLIVIPTPAPVAWNDPSKVTIKSSGTKLGRSCRVRVRIVLALFDTIPYYSTAINAITRPWSSLALNYSKYTRINSVNGGTLNVLHTTVVASHSHSKCFIVLAVPGALHNGQWSNFSKK